MSALDVLLFAVLPYVAILVAVLGAVYRYLGDRFSFSSQSSQFLGATKLLGVGSVAWHYAIILLLGAHGVAFLFVKQWGDLMSDQARLVVMEVTGWALAVAVVGGLAVLIARRLLRPRARVVTSRADWLLLALLLAQVFSGLWIAVRYAWGSVWYLNPVVPWLYSILTLNPQPDLVAPFPPDIKYHLLGGFLLLAVLPFTRLVHVLNAVWVVRYIWRPYQVVLWYRARTNGRGRA